MVGYLFAGQGSQYVGMGKDLYESFPEAGKVFDAADRTLGFSLSKLCFEGPQEELTVTVNCQPAILTMSIAAWKAFKAGDRGQGTGDSGYAAGLSLGEYSALVAAGALTFEDAVYLVRRRGEFMEEEARKKPGSMLSLIGMEPDAVRQLCVDTKTEMANLNCPGQTVISGGVQEIAQAEGMAKARGARMALRLEVSGAFHSSFMSGASQKLAQELAKIKISAPRIPVIANVTGKPVVSADEIRQNLIKQVSASVLWEDSMKFLIAQGVKDFYEFGPGKVLKGLMRRIDGSAQVTSIEKKEDLLSLARSQ